MVAAGSRRGLWLLFGALAAVTMTSLWLRSLVPEWVIADGILDDQLFVRGAFHLSNGDWLGPFDNRTLIKGPGYSVWLESLRWAGVPYLAGQHLAHLAASALMAGAVLRATRSRATAAVAFASLALDPSFFGATSSRLVRESWYASLCLAIVAVAWIALLEVAAGSNLARRAYSALLFGPLLGAGGAWYWLGREERMWLLPTFASMAGALLVLGRRRAGVNRGTWPVIAHSAAVFVVAVLVATPLVLHVQSRNKDHYGAPLVTDLSEGTFALAYGEWQRVVAGPTRDYVLVNQSQRAAVYDVSPAAATLAEELEGPLTEIWQPPGCAAVGVCGDYAAGWFPFAVRDAAARAGQFVSARTAQDYFSRLAGEIDAACRSGSLTCRSRLPLQPLIGSRLPKRPTLDAARRCVWFLATYQVAKTDRPLSSGDPGNYGLFRAVVIGLAPDLAGQQAQEQGAESWNGLFTTLRWGYSALSILLFPIALWGYLKQLWRRKLSLAWALGLTCAVAVAARVAILSVTEATAFPAVESGYVLPATGFLIVFLVVGAGQAVTQVDRRGPLVAPRLP
jgi:hypothetical protein